MFIPVSFPKLLLFFFLGFIPYGSPAQAPVAAALPALVKQNTLIFKLKPDYELSQREENRQRVRDLVTSWGPLVYKQKFPQAKSQPYLKPGEVDLSLIFEVEFPGTYTFHQLKNKLLATGLVTYVAPVNIPAPLYAPNDPFADSTLTNLGAPNQFYLRKIKAYQGWDITKGDSSIVIAILDTGIRYSHEDLKKNIKYNYADPIDGKDNDLDGYIDNFRGWDLADNDNNATADGSNHGVLVSGVAGAVPDNAKGLAGVGFNCRILPLKIYPTTIRGGFAGYEAIVYAADHGAHVINLSWGSPGLYSAYEQDIINYAVRNKNVVVVASAGNTGGLLDFYPASYENVISVAASDNFDQFPTFHSNSYRIDLMAPGIRVWTTGSSDDGNYTFGTGTSFSAPIVAGCAALVRHRFPAFNALQVAEQLRMTADDVYGVPNNTPFRERLGRGRVNLQRALSQTNVKAVRLRGTVVNKGKRIYGGDSLKIVSTFQNILAPVNNLAVSVTANSPYLTVVKGSFPAGALATLASTANTANPFVVYISPDVPPNTVLNLRFAFSDGTFTDYEYFSFTANPDYLTIDGNQLDVTVTSRGNFGYNGFAFDQGEGVDYKNGAPLLSEGGLMIGSSPTKVSDNIRNGKSVSDQDFFTLSPIRFENNPVYGEISAKGSMQDSLTTASHVGVKVSYRAFAWKNAPDHKYVMVEYKITNNTQSPLNTLYAGIFSDWDIGPANRNAAQYDSLRTLGYVFNVDKKDVYAGVKLLTPVVPTHYAIDNGFGPFANINLADGFSEAEKYKALSNPVKNNLTAGFNGAGNDVSDVVGGRLPILAPGESFQIAFALLAGDNLADLQQGAEAAQRRYVILKTGPVPVARIDTICPGSTARLAPAQGKKFRFYADPAGTTLLATGAAFTTPALTQTTTFYVSNADSLYESARVAYTVVPFQPQADFTFSPDPITAAAKGQVTFHLDTPGAVSWQWDFGNEGQGTGANPTVRYKSPGKYQVSLTIKDKRGCSATIMKEVNVQAVAYNRHWQPGLFNIYPNPNPGPFITVDIPLDTDTEKGLLLVVLNALGAKVRSYQVNTAGKIKLELGSLKNGMYLLQISGRDGTVTRKFQVMQQ